MAGRKILALVLWIIVGSFSVYVLFPRFQNGWNCEDSVPSNAAESMGLEDARTRTASACSASRHRCMFGIHADIDGSFRVSLYFFETSFFEGCVSKGQYREVFVYSREGRFIRVEEAPYA